MMESWCSAPQISPGCSILPSAGGQRSLHPSPVSWFFMFYSCERSILDTCRVGAALHVESKYYFIRFSKQMNIVPVDIDIDTDDFFCTKPRLPNPT